MIKNQKTESVNRRQLLAAGISESVLFPGLPGLSREIRDAYTADMSFDPPDEPESEQPGSPE